MTKTFFPQKKSCSHFALRPKCLGYGLLAELSLKGVPLQNDVSSCAFSNTALPHEKDPQFWDP